MCKQWSVPADQTAAVSPAASRASSVSS
jgi:hypothetical protein